MAPSSAPTLYDLCISRVALLCCKRVQGDHIWPQLTDAMKHSVLTKLALIDRVEDMFRYTKDEDTFFRLLALGDCRGELHALFQMMVDNPNTPLHIWLTGKVTQTLTEDSGAVSMKYKRGCVTLGVFLIDAGWFACGAKVLEAVKKSIPETQEMKLTRLQVDLRILQALSSDCQLSKSKELYERLSQRTELDQQLKAPFYGQFTAHCLSRSLYHDAYSWAVRAVQELHLDHPPKVQIDVLRHASRACVLRRKFTSAEALIEKAVLLAHKVYGPVHLKYSDALMDYGFYLLNVDSVDKSVMAYSKALEVRRHVFKKVNNLRVATILEDLAYATYVRNYNSGLFFGAQELAENSLQIMERLLPKSHILHASPMRVLALILEEIAIDEPNHAPRLELLKRAEDLHIHALKLSIDSYGLMNVQTAKHYGNLGRLYQSMRKFPQAEQMHIRAVCIKEELLGTEDYELALSIGHLASLYNYDMKQFARAETLYLRSISIGEKLFGSAYSGLEYDYRGLLKVYREMSDWDKTVEYMNKLRRWQDLRDAKRQNEREEEQSGLLSKAKDRTLEEIAEVMNIATEAASADEPSSSSASDSPPESLVPLLMADQADDVLQLMDLDFDADAAEDEE